MKNFLIQKNSLLLLLGGIVIISTTLTCIFTAGNAFIQQPAIATPTATAPYTPLAELAQARPPKACNAKQRHFQMGIAFPQWGATAYSEHDAKWLTELPDMRTQAAACDAALANIIPDQHILGSFFWGWDDAGAFNLNGLQAAAVIHSYYKTLQV